MHSPACPRLHPVSWLALSSSINIEIPPPPSPRQTNQMIYSNIYNSVYISATLNFEQLHENVLNYFFWTFAGTAKKCKEIKPKDKRVPYNVQFQSLDFFLANERLGKAWNRTPCLPIGGLSGCKLCIHYISETCSKLIISYTIYSVQTEWKIAPVLVDK